MPKSVDIAEYKKKLFFRSDSICAKRQKNILTQLEDKIWTALDSSGIVNSSDENINKKACRQKTKKNAIYK